jgi:predicted MPP superfamily phosphohydrolase
MKKWFWLALSAVCAVCAVAVVGSVENQALQFNTYTLSSQELPTPFDGFRIAQVSDLHNAEIGKDNEKLLNNLQGAQPNIIVLTGDLIDSRKTKVDVALEFAEQAMQIAPCYYVTGNHEARVTEYSELKEGLTSLGVVVLEDTHTKVELDGESITLLGVNDPSFQTDYLLGDAEAVMRDTLSRLTEETDGFTVLLSHRPELFDIYVEFGIDLVFSGHAHGGQFRLPLIGGLFAPNQGFFPKYDGGMFTQGNTSMLVSRGVGNSIIPFRINNKPEIILMELIKGV